jgi:hypothetical protein
MVLSRRQSISHAFHPTSSASSAVDVDGEEGEKYPPGKTFAGQSQLPKLPIPPLEETMGRYLRALEGLQVRYFLAFEEGMMRGIARREECGRS